MTAARRSDPCTGRVVVEHVRPTVDCGGLAAKAAVGQPLRVSADVFADGHDMLMAWVRHGRPGARQRVEEPMTAVGNDHWQALFTPPRQGAWEFEIAGMVDDYGTWLRDLRVRIGAGQEVAVEFEVGARMVEQRLSGAEKVRAADRIALTRLRDALRDDSLDDGARLTEASRLPLVALMQRLADRRRAATAGPFPLWVDRELGAFSAWYEMFPRSEGAHDGVSGTFESAAPRLPAIAAMGFDIVYLPPIHPIGATFRKGPNNTLDPRPSDPGSPWAIGGEAGGHTAVNPELGTLEDFDRFVARARALGLEVALDYAVQSSPDHPWVREHPQWFKHRPDGSIRYAENPPKRYQDIYPLDFDTEDREALWNALRDVVLFWIGHGVTVFRVDNPHTKPIAFWQWLIDDVRAKHPDTVFLAEAFTRPRVMQRLAKVGFTQSYTYFTWRNAKWEIEEYLRELTQTEMVDWFRPNFWPNTPDILHETLQYGGPPAFRLRLLLAAMASSSWGMYSGYELYENTPLREGSEEYLNSEKYQLRPRDWGRADSLAPMITRINEIRRAHRGAVGLLRTLQLHAADSDAVLCFSRATDERDDVVLVVVNLDPFNTREATLWLDLAALGLRDSQYYEVHDELSGQSWVWHGAANYVRLDPAVQPGHVFAVRPR
ncbi:MAG TPA: alpha-1,4-glucan--maltose-1-phosphate maltosyltransferase [Candidatus Angelobacter sp.]|jgi:starch synthase (maltosyl-transferring)|nr:alpha-1,4-glucan--maltose-1-phosphate maltosyltransferase [Candidatus Angelobacter sp.]